MSLSVDKTGERTLAVVTKVDMAPEGLLEKVTADDVHIGLGYVYVRNRIRDRNLPDFVPRNAFLIVLQRKVEWISRISIGFVEQVWSYIEDVVLPVLTRNTENHYHVQLSARRAGYNLIEKMKERSINWMKEIVEMEKLTDYTCNPEYLYEWHRLMTKQETFIQKVLRDYLTLGLHAKININVEGIGMVEVGGLRKYPHVLLSQAFDLKMRITVYWNVVLRRLIDLMGLHLQLSVSNLVNPTWRWC